MEINFALINLIYTISMFIGMLLLMEVGRQIALRRMAADSDGARTGIGTVEGALLALLGLLIAFSFSGAANRFDQRRQQIVEEAGAIGSAYMHIDLLPPDAQPKVRETFRQYLDSRLESYRRLPELARAKAELERSKVLQNDIWNQAVAATRGEGYQAAALQILPAVGKMVDISSKRTAAIFSHPPQIIFIMLAALMLICSMLAGYGMASARSRNWLHMIAFAIMLALTFFVIRDLEFPRLPGLVGMNNFDNVLVELRNNMR